MRILSTIPAAGRYLFAFLVIAGSVAVMSAPRRNAYTIHDKEFYLDPLAQQFIRPGLVINIVSATIGQDGTIAVDYKVTDPKGVALDLAGITTPGPISLSYLIASIPKGQEQYVSYITRNATDAVNGSGRTVVQATGDSGGTLQAVALGEYIYTFRNKAPAGFDGTATHRLGIYGNRNLTEFDLGTNYDDATIDFVPAGGTPAPRDVVRTADCNKCHDSLAAHGGSRKSVELCIVCHTPQTTDPETNNTLDFKVFIHKLHDGSGLPSVKAGTPYQIIGFGNSVNDYSTVNYPADVRRCNTCHNPKNGAAQTNAWLTSPTRASCGSCHDDINFATGKNHSADNIPEVSDNQCAQCHMPQGDLEFDTSIKGAHVYPQESAANPGLVFAIQKVVNGGPGQNPTVTFTVKDFAGNGISMAQLTGGSNRVALVLAGPTADYGDTSLGADTNTPGYVSENPVPKASCSPDGTCTYTFTHAIPATATGTYSVGIEGRRTFTINPNTLQAQNVNYGANNAVFNFSVDGSPVQARRTVVNINNCNGCHARLSLHGENRNQIQQCVLCHNPSDSDAALRATSTNAADKAAPAQGVNFAMMIHKIHTGEALGAAGQTYTIVGFGGSHNDFSDVRYPVMGPTGATGDTAKCYMCHVQTPTPTEAILPIGKRNVVDPQGLLNPAPATTSACTACHFARSAVAHADLNTDPKFGETCDVCHATGSQFDVDKMHAGK